MTDTDWDRRFLELADHIAGWSKDPSRGVGAVIVGPNKQILATGYNGLPRGVDDRPERLERPAKYDLIVHAEMNAIVHCARDGISPVNATIYVTFMPCIRCSTDLPTGSTRSQSQSRKCTADGEQCPKSRL